MLDSLKLNDLELLDFTDAAGTGMRDVTRVEGLVGLAQPRGESKPRAEAHGVTNRSRFMSSKNVLIEGEAWGSDIDKAGAQLSLIEKAAYASLTDPLGALLKWYRKGMGVDNPVVNHVLNPSAEVDGTTAVAASNGGTVTQENAPSTDQWPSSSGSKCFGVVSAIANPGAAGSAVTWNATGIVAGNTYTAAAEVYTRTQPNASGFTNRLIVTWYDGANAFIDDDIFDILIPESSPGVLCPRYGRLSATVVAPANAVTAKVTVYDYGVLPANWQWFVDAVMLTDGEWSGYFDGDSRASSWAGTRGNSVSTQTPGVQARVKLMAPFAPPLEGGAAYMPYQAQFEQLDPRAYSQALRSVKSSTPYDSSGGLSFPFEFPFSFAQNAETSVLAVNNGEVETPPVMRIYGPVSNPRYVDDAGKQIKIKGDIEYGSYLEVDHAARTLKVNGLTSVMHLLDATDSTFFELDPGRTVVSLYVDSYGAGSYLEVRSRDAYAG